jgi:hypothetical protein
MMRKTVSAPEVKKPARAALTGGMAVNDQVILSGQMAYDPDVDGIPADMDAAAQTRVIMDQYRAPACRGGARLWRYRQGHDLPDLSCRPSRNERGLFELRHGALSGTLDRWGGVSGYTERPG